MIKKCVLKWGDNEVEVLEPKGMNPVQIINKNKDLNPLAEWASKEMKEIFTIYPDVIKCEVIQNKAFFTGIIKERKPTNLETFSGMDEGGEMERPEVFLEVCEVEK